MAHHKFRRQHPVGPFFADFACLSARLIVEVDGAQHADQALYDARRTRHLETQGFRVIRFDDRQVLTELPAVLEVIRSALEGRVAGRTSKAVLASEAIADAEHLMSSGSSNLATTPHPDPLPEGGARGRCTSDGANRPWRASSAR